MFVGQNFPHPDEFASILSKNTSHDEGCSQSRPLMVLIKIVYRTALVVVEQLKYCEKIATTNVKKYAQRTGENIDINRRKSPFQGFFL